MKNRKIKNVIKNRISPIPSNLSAKYDIDKESRKFGRKQIKTYFKIFNRKRNDALKLGLYEINLSKIWRKRYT